MHHMRIRKNTIIRQWNIEKMHEDIYSIKVKKIHTNQQMLSEAHFEGNKIVLS